MNRATGEQWLTEEQKRRGDEMSAFCLQSILSEFDFKKASAALRDCGWKFECGSTPTADELRATAENLLRSVLTHGSEIIESSQGPLWVTMFNGNDRAVKTIRLILVPVWTSTVFIDEVELSKQRQRRDKRKSAKRKPEGSK